MAAITKRLLESMTFKRSVGIKCTKISSRRSSFRSMILVALMTLQPILLFFVCFEVHCHLSRSDNAFSANSLFNLNFEIEKALKVRMRKTNKKNFIFTYAMKIFYAEDCSLTLLTFFVWKKTKFYLFFDLSWMFETVQSWSTWCFLLGCR